MNMNAQRERCNWFSGPRPQSVERWQIEEYIRTKLKWHYMQCLGTERTKSEIEVYLRFTHPSFSKLVWELIEKTCRPVHWTVIGYSKYYFMQWVIWCLQKFKVTVRCVALPCRASAPDSVLLQYPLPHIDPRGIHIHVRFVNSTEVIDPKGVRYRIHWKSSAAQYEDAIHRVDSDDEEEIYKGHFNCYGEFVPAKPSKRSRMSRVQISAVDCWWLLSRYFAHQISLTWRISLNRPRSLLWRWCIQHPLGEVQLVREMLEEYLAV